MSIFTIKLNGPITIAKGNFDNLITDINSMDNSDQLQLDFENITFVNPEALILLASASKLAYEKSRRPVIWKEIKTDVYSYIERVNISNLSFIVIKKPKNFVKFNRAASQSSNLVEFSVVSNWKEISDVIGKTKGVLNRWFSDKDMAYRRNLTTIVKETIENSIDHSGQKSNEGICYYAVQKYFHKDGTIEVQIAVGDVGVGMLESLRRVHPSTKDDVEAIRGALIEGKSGRETRRGGLGYRTIKTALESLNGNLTIRSGRASVWYASNCPLRVYRQKPIFPGTQIIFHCKG